MKLKAKMTRAEIIKAKKEAKGRKNRRLDDGMYARLLALNTCKENNGNDLPIIDLNEYRKTTSEEILANSENLINDKKPVEKIRVAGRHANLKDQILAKMTDASSTPLKNRKNGRRLSDKQFKNLMKKASVELGINDAKGLDIMNLLGVQYHTNDDLIDLIMNTSSRGNLRSNLLNEYKKTIRSKSFDFGDKLSILQYLIKKESKPNTEKPMCLLSKNEKTDTVRKTIKPWGDIKVRPFRIIPDEEYLLELSGKKRTKFDYFDKLDTDNKIEWARYASLILNMGGNVSNPHSLPYGKLPTTELTAKFQNAFDCEAIVFAMKYACKMSKLPEFKGIFRSPYWIYHRVEKFSDIMTNKEYNVFYKMALEFLNLNDNRRSIPILDDKQAIEKILPFLKSAKLYKKYCEIVDNKHNRCSNLEVVKNLLKRRIENDIR